MLQRILSRHGDVDIKSLVLFNFSIKKMFDCLFRILFCLFFFGLRFRIKKIIRKIYFSVSRLPQMEKLGE